MLINKISERLSRIDIYRYNTLTIARSILALSTLITLLFTTSGDIFLKGVPKSASFNFFNQINFFSLFNGNMELCRWLGVLVMLSVISGFAPFITGLLQWWVASSLYNFGTLVDGGDQINSILCFFLIPITLLDWRWNAWRPKSGVETPHVNIVNYYLILLIKIQVAVIYLHSVIEKVRITEWVDGTALYYYLNNTIYGPPGFLRDSLNVLFSNKYTMVASTWAILLFELLLFCALFMSQKSKNVYLVLGILFHFSIIFIHGLPSFFFSMLGALILYLYPLNKNLSLKRV